MTERDEYVAAGYKFEAKTYVLPDGRSFTIDRPVGLCHRHPYYGRTISFDEFMAIWAYHSGPVPGSFTRSGRAL
jgi:hypothetical protein